MNYDLFLCDFDGTLVSSDGTVSEKNKRAIARYRAHGGIFVICTGRMMKSIRARLLEIGLTEGLVAAFHGAQIADISSGKLLKDAHFEEEDILGILRFMESHGLRHQIYAKGELIAPRRTALLEAYERICGVQAQISERPLSDMVASDHLKVTKTLAICEKEETERVCALLTREFGEKYYVATSSDYLVEIMPKGENKAAACAFLSDFYGVPKERIAAIGDHAADLPMLLAAGGRFAVANAVPALKAVATVVPSADGDGVAYALETYAMGEPL